MKKIFASMMSLVVLLAFGFITLRVIARPQPAGPTLKPFAAEEASYEISQPDYDWLDVSARSDEKITVENSDDMADNIGSPAIDLGFYFPFFDGIYRQVRISDNGYVYFDAETDGGNIPQAIPSHTDAVHNFIAPFGADLFRAGDTAVYIARQAEPERRVVLQFARAYWCCSVENPLDFELALYPDGRILTQYKSIQNDTAPHAYLMVGLENKDGNQGYNFYTGFLDETDTLRNEMAVMYDPGDTVFGRVLYIPNVVPGQGRPGQTVTLQADLLNLSGAETNFKFTQTMQVNGVDVPTATATTEAESGGENPTEPTPAWSATIVSAPEQVSNTDSRPLVVEVIIPATAVAGDTAVLSVQAASEAEQGLSATVTFTIEVLPGGQE